MLDVTATLNEAGNEVVLAVVNRDRERAHAITINLADNATIEGGIAYEVNGAHPEVVNSLLECHGQRTQSHDQSAWSPHEFFGIDC